MKTMWYLWAVHNHPPTNQYLVHVIGEGNEENLFSNKLCADGKKRDLFMCPMGYTNVQNAISAIQEFSLKIEVFKEDIKDVITRYDLWKKSARKKANVMRRSATMLRPHGRAS